METPEPITLTDLAKKWGIEWPGKMNSVYELAKEIERRKKAKGGIPTDFDEIAGFTLGQHVEWFNADATNTCVPLGMAIIRFAILLQAIDHHLYSTGQIGQSEAREMIRNAASLMDKKFDLEYRRLPQ